MEFPHSQRSKLSLLGLSKGFWPAQHVWDNIGKGKKPLEFAGGGGGVNKNRITSMGECAHACVNCMCVYISVRQWHQKV